MPLRSGLKDNKTKITQAPKASAVATPLVSACKMLFHDWLQYISYPNQLITALFISCHKKNKQLSCKDI